MASSAEWKIGQSIEWRTRFPHSGRISSPGFKLFDVECYFLFILRNNYDDMLLKQRNDPVGLPVFSVKVIAQSERSGTATKTSTKILSNAGAETEVWSMYRNSVLSGKDGFKEDDKLRFFFSFTSVVAPSFQYIRTDAKICQDYLSDDLQKLLDGDTDKDVELRCGERVIRAHKVILSARSSVFSAMFNSDMKEGRTGSVELPEMEEAVYQNFVRYLYTGKTVQLDWNSAKNLYEAGDQYAVEGLKKLCAIFMTERLTKERSIECLVLADAHNDQDFKNNVIHYMHDNDVPILDDLWQPFCREHPALSIEVLNCLYKRQRCA